MYKISFPFLVLKNTIFLNNFSTTAHIKCLPQGPNALYKLESAYCHNTFWQLQLHFHCWLFKKKIFLISLIAAYVKFWIKEPSIYHNDALWKILLQFSSLVLIMMKIIEDSLNFFLFCI